HRRRHAAAGPGPRRGDVRPREPDYGDLHPRQRMNVLVTGGAGFIGSHVADALVARGYRVHVLDDLSGGRRENVPAGATFHELDIRSAGAAELLRTGGFD